MVDPAITGLIGTGIGGVIGFAGTALTSWRTTKREERARLFAEKRKVYADTLLAYQESTEYFAGIQRKLWDKGEEHTSSDGMSERRNQADLVIIMIASKSVLVEHKALTEAFGRLINAVTVAVSQETTLEEWQESGMFEKQRQDVIEAHAKAAYAMRKDLGVKD